MPKNKFYITTTLPYVNAKPHIGFALELIQTDVIARYHALLGEEVIFNTGTDEHGVNIFRKAEELGIDTQTFVDQNAEQFKKLLSALHISNDRFVRTTSEHHKKAAAEFWNRCFAAGDIYKAKYKIKYCTGCELEKTDSELSDGRCILHPSLTIEEREEENYFFKFSKYQEQLLKFYNDNPNVVLPEHRLNEIKNFVESGLKDFSVSRLKEKMPWGVTVPNDPEHVMYVWFDALVNYISTLGWPEDEQFFSAFWPGTQTAGKDNLRQQSAIWQAMLMSAGLPNSKHVLIHGFINVDGQKMSKTLGNVIDPFTMVEKYGVDPVRYFLLREIPSGDDGDFSEQKLVQRYNGDLANGLGNLVSRVTTLVSRNLDNELVYEEKFLDKEIEQKIYATWNAYGTAINNFKLHEAVAAAWELIGVADKYMNDRKPWAESETSGEEFLKTMTSLMAILYNLTGLLLPIIPETAQKIANTIGIKEKKKKLATGDKLLVIRGPALFPRLEV